MRVWWAGLLLLAACDGAPSGTTPPPAPSPVNDYASKVAALTPGQRDAVLLRAIRDARQDCQAVVGSAAGGEQFGMPSWVARCSNGLDWVVMLRPDGTALVARRGEKPAG